VTSLDDAAMLDVEAVRATFPEWRIFQAHRVWWAARGGLQEWTGPASLLARVLCAETLKALAEKLSLQEYLDHLTPGELAKVYRDCLTVPGVYPHPR